MISNASPLIILAKIGILKKAIGLYSAIEIPQSVFDECITAGLENKKEDAVLLNALWKQGSIKLIHLDKKHLELSKKIEVEYRLDAGEAEVLALALQLKKKSVLMDEALGRNVAELFELQPKGTLRVILAARSEQHTS